MMTSYLTILASQLVHHDYLANLFDLVGFGHRSLRLQIQNLHGLVLCEDVVASANTFNKSQVIQAVR